jgi:hypothetical protein
MKTNIDDLLLCTSCWDKKISSDLIKEVEEHLSDKVATIPEMRRVLAVKGYSRLRLYVESEVANAIVLFSCVSSLSNRKSIALWYHLAMKTENIVAASFIAGALTGLAVMTWVVIYPLSSWSNSRQFANFSKNCIISDMGATYQVYCSAN